MNIRMIPLKDMRIDMSYQRYPNEKRIKSISNNWSDMKANLIHVSHRADGYYVMDGNHTRLAAMVNGKTELPCRVYEGLSQKEEAAYFTELNSSQKKPSFNEMLKAKAEAGSELESTYLDMLDKVGIKYTFTNGSHKLTLKCHSALLSVYSSSNYDLMLRAISVTKKAAADREEFYQIGFFPGMCSLITKHPEVDDIRLIDVVSKTTTTKIREIADKYRRGITGSGVSSIRTFRLAFLEIYNKGLRKKKIIERED